MSASDKALEHFLGMRAAIDQFHQLSQEDMHARAKEHPSDLLQVLGAHADFKWQILGEEGAAHLDSLVNLAREWDDSVKRAVHRRTLRDSIEWQFCDRFLKKQQTATASLAESVLRRAISHSKGKCRDGTVAVPCRVTDDPTPEAFSFGGIEFVRRDMFLQQMQDEGRLTQKELQDYVVSSSLKSSPWIAVGTYRQLDPKLGRQRVLEAVQAALELLAAFLRPDSGSQIATTAVPSMAIPTAMFECNDNKEWHVSWKMYNLQASFGEGWHEYLHSQMEPFLSAAATVVANKLTPHKPYPLEQRFLDGLHWFGHASRESSAANRITACVFSLERLVMTREVDDLRAIARSFAQRSVVLAMEFEGYKAIERFPKLLELYNIRSRIVHGDVSPSEETVQSYAGFALAVTRAALLGSLATYARIFEGQGSDADLQKYFALVAPPSTGENQAGTKPEDNGMVQPELTCKLHNVEMKKLGRSDSVLSNEKGVPVPVWSYRCEECAKQPEGNVSHYALIGSLS